MISVRKRTSNNINFRRKVRSSQRHIQVPNINKEGGLPWWLSGKDFACQCKRNRFNPWSGRIPCATEQLGPCATAVEPVLQSPELQLLSPCAATTAPQTVLYNKRSHCNGTREDRHVCQEAFNRRLPVCCLGSVMNPLSLNIQELSGVANYSWGAQGCMHFLRWFSHTVISNCL